MSPDDWSYYQGRIEVLAREVGSRDYYIQLLLAAGDDLIEHGADAASRSWWNEAKREAESKVRSRIPSSAQANDEVRP